MKNNSNYLKKDAKSIRLSGVLKEETKSITNSEDFNLEELKIENEKIRNLMKRKEIELHNVQNEILKKSHDISQLEG